MNFATDPTPLQCSVSVLTHHTYTLATLTQQTGKSVYTLRHLARELAPKPPAPMNRAQRRAARNVAGRAS